MTLRSQWIWATLLFVIVGVAVLGVRPMVPPDEPRYGIIAAEMAETGHWLSLRMAGFHYYEKPPLAYWLMAASVSLFGENAFALRLPGAFATGVTALVTGLLCARMTARRELGPVAFAVQATTIGPAVLGTVATIDPIFTMWITLSLASLYAALSSRGRVRLIALVGAGAAAGLAFLTKGALGVAIPAVAGAGFLSWERRWRDLLIMPWIPLLAAAAVVAPFALALHRAEPGFWEYFLVVEHWRRFTQPDSNQHAEPAWFLVAALPVLGVMWTLMWWQAGKGIARVAASRTAVRFAAAWIFFALTILSLSLGKVPTYILPLFPAVSILVTIGLAQAHDAGIVAGAPSHTVGRWILCVLGAGALALAIFGTQWLGAETLWASSETIRWSALATALFAWAVIDRWSSRAATTASWLLRAATAPVAVIALIPALFPTAGIRTSAIPWRILAENATAIRTAESILSTSQMAHCVSWTTGRRDLMIVGYPSEFDNELAIPDEAARLLTLEEAIERVRTATARSESVALVVLPSEAATAERAAGIPAPTTRAIDGDVAILVWSGASKGIP
ncbi:MAG: phospholipid carrier-dependent glycosyltransferase [Phycisphaerales bacterium]|nr:phospholipid carrier-dependent glycosyltransferase [Phycisphaerales bacterium]